MNELATIKQMLRSLLVYTYTMRPGARFSDGQPITPADIKYTYMRLMAPAVDTGTGVYFVNVIARIAM